MLRITDRYILREVLAPFCLSLMVFTFLLLLPPIMDVAEPLITKGVDALTVAKLMVMLLPQGLGVTIPMAVLIGLLMGFGRLSGDRETVALQACGISLVRMLHPVLLLAVAATGATIYVLVVALPDANQAFRELTYRTLATRAEEDVRPRVFFEDFPNTVLYVRDLAPGGAGWTDVFLVDTRKADHPDIYVAERGRVALDRERRLMDLVLFNGSLHRVNPNEPGTYEVQHFEHLVLSIDSDAVFPDGVPSRGYPELTIPQLEEEAERLRKDGLSPHRAIMEIHRKFSIPVACLVFGLIGLGLGVTSRKDGKLASFTLGVAVIFAYYVIMYTAEAMAKAALVSPHWALWLPNIVLGAFGMGLICWRSRSVERRIRLPFLSSWLSAAPASPSLGTPTDLPRPPAQICLTAIPSAIPGNREADGLPSPGLRRGPGRVRGLSGVTLSILDSYVALTYLRWVVLAFVGLLGLFYISTFIDLSDKLFKGQASGRMLIEYFWYATPQFVYYVLPISALLATLITIGVLTKNSELTVMKACGVSLYRTAGPLLLFSLLWSALLFGLSETLLAESNRKAEAVRHVIRGGSPQTFDVLNRKWIVGKDGSIYHYMYLDPRRDEINGLTIHKLDGRPWRLTERTFATRATFDGTWRAEQVWNRKFQEDGSPSEMEFTETARSELSLEPPDYFKTEQPDAERMSYRELSAYIRELQSRGFDVVQLAVALHRKLSFPFVSLILTLIAVPFAVTTGPRGALYGIGVGIALAVSYWIIISIFAAIGSAGLVAAPLAAWAPNVLFGASAVFLLLTVQT